MDINQAKTAVIEAGKMLVSNGLIQRTWGNVSCRISATQFAITPSGREYMSLTPEEIVIVNISDLSYEGNIKPSSEKGIHAQCYALRPECNFVIHTHQTYASMIGLGGLDINDIPKASAELIGSEIPVAPYGLPGTGKLRDGVVSTIKRSASKALLMIHHGALCMGADLDEAFAIANEVEKVCKAKLFERYYNLTGRTTDTFTSLSEYVASTLKKGSKESAEFEAYFSERDGDAMEMTPAAGGKTVIIDLESGQPYAATEKYPESAELHSAIYKQRKDVNAIIHTKEENTLAVSKIGKTVKPFLDDFTQIAGITLKNGYFDTNNTMRTAKSVTRKLKRRDAVLIKDNGAICVGSDSEDAKAVELVVEKGCMAYAAANLLHKEKTFINPVECVLMRVIYKKKYSKQAK